MPQPRKTASPWRADRGASTVGASWFVLILVLIVFCFLWYLDSMTQIREDALETIRQDRQRAARTDRTEYRKAQLQALTNLVGARSAVPVLPGADVGSTPPVTRVRDMKTFADDVAKYATPMFDRGTESSKHKPDFYLKRFLDEDSMVPPALPIAGVTYDVDAYRNATDKKTFGLGIMTDVRKLFSTPFGGDASDARNTKDGEFAIKLRDLRAQWSTLYDAVQRNVAGEDAAAEVKAVDAVRSVGAGDAWTPTITLNEIVQQIALKYSDLRLDTDRLRAAWEIAHGGVEAPEDAAWNDLRRAARVLQAGDKAGWDQKLAAARQTEREALKQELSAAYGMAGVGDELVQRFVAARLAAKPAESTIALLGGKPPEAGADVTPVPFTPLTEAERSALEDANRKVSELDTELRRVEGELGWTEGKERIGSRLDLHVERLAEIDRYGEIAALFTEKRGGDETYSYSVEGYRAFLTERANAMKTSLQRTLEDLRREAVAFDERYAGGFAARTGLPEDLYQDPSGRKTATVGGEAKDTAEAYGLPFGEQRGPAELDSVVNRGIGDLSKVLEWAKAATAALEKRRNEEVVPATTTTEKRVRDRGQRLGGLLVSDSIETVFPDVVKGHVLQAPAGPIGTVRVSTPSVMPVAFVDLDASDNLRPGLTFFVVEQLPLGRRFVKAVATVERIGAEGQPTRVVLSYLPGVDSLTHAVVRGDVLENSIFNARYRRNAVVVSPEGESYSAVSIQDVLAKQNFAFQAAVDENTDMVILSGSRGDSLRAMAPNAEGEAGDEKPWFQENPAFQEAERRGLNVFFYEDDVRVRVPGLARVVGGAR